MSQRQAMRGKSVTCGSSEDSNGCGMKITTKQLEQETGLGNFIWVKLRNNLWWPAQIVDDNAISESSKPRKRAAASVLVRLYGSYEYLYVDPIKCHSEFEIVLEHCNGSYREIFEKTLEQVCQREKSARSKEKGPKSTVSVQDKVKKNAKSNGVGAQDEATCRTPKKDEGTSLFSNSEEISARKLRVMRVLGLTAPPGSPYSKNGKVLQVCDDLSQ